MQPYGYDALIYKLRTLDPVSFYRLFVFLACSVVRFSSFVSKFVRLSAPHTTERKGSESKKEGRTGRKKEWRNE